MTRSPTPFPVAPMEQTALTAAIQERLKWYRLLFTLAAGGAVWTGLQIARKDEVLVESIMDIFLVELDGLAAAWIALFILVMGLFLITTQIYDNIGKLGDPEAARAARLYRVAAVIILLIGTASCVFMQDATMKAVRSGYHVVAIAFVFLLCVVGDFLLERFKRKTDSWAWRAGDPVSLLAMD